MAKAVNQRTTKAKAATKEKPLTPREQQLYETYRYRKEMRHHGHDIAWATFKSVGHLQKITYSMESLERLMGELIDRIERLESAIRHASHMRQT